MREGEQAEYQIQEAGRQTAARLVSVLPGETRQKAVLKYQYQEKCFEPLSFYLCVLVNKYH